MKANKKILGDLQLNIFGLFSIEKQEIYAYETGIGKRETTNVLNLLSIPVYKNYVLNEKKKVKTEQHLVIINDLNAFMTQKTGKGSNRTRRKLCLKCLNYFKNDFTLKKHKLSCNNPRGQVETMPEEGETMYNRHPLQLKKSKSWEPLGSYQLNSTADLANLAQI